jgi:PAS domain-containing protein
MCATFRSGDALFACDAETLIALRNAEAERATGIAADDAVGRPCRDALHGVRRDRARRFRLSGRPEPRTP